MSESSPGASSPDPSQSGGYPPWAQPWPYQPGGYQPAGYPLAGHPPGLYPGYPAYPPYPPYAPRLKPRHPRAIAVLVLGCVATIGAVFTGGLTVIVGPVAWGLGAQAKREIAAEPGRWAEEELVTIGYILGIVATGLLVLGLMGIAILVVVAAGLVSA